MLALYYTLILLLLILFITSKVIPVDFEESGCRGDDIQLQCCQNEVIIIEKSIVGTSSVQCTECCPSDSECTDSVHSNVLTDIQDKCNYKDTCTFTAVDDVCNNQDTDFQTIFYKCLEERHEYGCQPDGTYHLYPQCTGEAVIHITRSILSLSRKTCPPRMCCQNKTRCRFQAAETKKWMTKARHKCDNKQSCTLLRNHIYCRKAKKPTDFQHLYYVCVANDKVPAITTTNAEPGTTKIHPSTIANPLTTIANPLTTIANPLTTIANLPTSENHLSTIANLLTTEEHLATITTSDTTWEHLSTNLYTQTKLSTKISTQHLHETSTSTSEVLQTLGITTAEGNPDPTGNDIAHADPNLRIGIIVGAALGAGLALVLVIIGVCLLMRCRAKPAAQKEESSGVNSETNATVAYVNLDHLDNVYYNEFVGRVQDMQGSDTSGIHGGLPNTPRNLSGAYGPAANNNRRDDDVHSKSKEESEYDYAFGHLVQRGLRDASKDSKTPHTINTYSLERGTEVYSHRQTKVESADDMPRESSEVTLEDNDLYVIGYDEKTSPEHSSPKRIGFPKLGPKQEAAQTDVTMIRQSSEITLEDNDMYATGGNDTSTYNKTSQSNTGLDCVREENYSYAFGHFSVNHPSTLHAASDEAAPKGTSLYHQETKVADGGDMELNDLNQDSHRRNSDVSLTENDLYN